MKRLLLVEDDFDVAEMLILYFKSKDYEVFHADTGKLGIELARAKFPNLILLDIMLGDMDGYDICRNLRQVSLTKYIPVLFLTQRDERASKVRGLELGADDYITKPFDIDELRLRVERSIRQATRENLHESRTGLPTGRLVQDEILRRQSANTTFSSFVYTIEGFAAYSDSYGFVAANSVLNRAGAIIQKMIAKDGTPDDFVGIVDDSLVMFTHSTKADQIDTAIRKQFNEESRAFYTFADVDQGGILLGPDGDRKLIPLMTLKGRRELPVNTPE